jgi:hypothetical protein
VFDECVSCGDCLNARDDVTSRRSVPLIMRMPEVGAESNRESEIVNQESWRRANAQMVGM